MATTKSTNNNLKNKSDKNISSKKSSKTSKSVNESTAVTKKLKKESTQNSITKDDKKNIVSTKSPKKSFTIKFPKNNPIINKLLSLFGFLLIIIAVFLIIDFLFQYKYNSLSVAVINGESINRDKFRQKLEKGSCGQTELGIELQYVAIEQEAKARGILITSEEFNDFYKILIPNEEIEKQAQADMAKSGITIDDYKNELRIILLGTRILMVDDPINEEELQTFFETYKSALYPSEDPTFESKKTEITQYYILDKYIKSKQLETLGKELVSKSTIQNNITAEPKYSPFKYTINIIQSLQERLNSKTEE